MTNKAKQLIVNKRYNIAAFFLPVLILVLVFAIIRIFPFGDNQLAIIDMYHQYIPFLSELQYKLHGGGSLFYTWNGAGGSNFWCLMAYYGASPLNLLLILFPGKFISEGAALVLLVKVGLTGSFMFLYLKETQYPGFNDKDACACWHTVAFSSMYALCSYVLAYYWCIMWMDAVMLLPLIILGLNWIIEGRGYKLYTISLALTVFINYYMAIMVCIFIFCYYPVLYFIKTKKASLKPCLRTTGKAVGLSFLAIGMSAIMLLPTYLSMKNAYYISSEMPETVNFYHDPLNIFNQLLPEAHLTYREGLPNLYCGMIVVIMLAFYFMSRRIATKEKVLNLGLIFFLFLSLNINKLDFIWHGFHFPNQLPHRFSFVICFLLVGMAYRAFAEINEVTCRQIGSLLAVGLGYYILAQKILKDSLDDPNRFFYYGVGLLIAYCALLYVYRQGLLRRRNMTILLVVVMSAELICSAGFSFDKTGTTSRSEYLKNYDGIRFLAEKTNEEFVRTEMDSRICLNTPALYHYKGLSQFSSSINANATNVMEAIGLEGQGPKNRYNYNMTNPVTNAILGVKYIITRGGKLKNEDFEYVAKGGKSRLYKSKYPLAIGYMAPDSVRLWNPYDDDPFENLNDYVGVLTEWDHKKVFREEKLYDYEAHDIDLNVGEGYIESVQENSDATGEVKLKYKARKTGNHYVFVEAAFANSITVERMDTSDNVTIQKDCGSIINIGEIQKDEIFAISIVYDQGQGGVITSKVCTMDYKNWNKAYKKMAEQTMKVDEFSSNRVKGRVDVKDKTILVTSIPYEDGWTMKVDGRPRDITELTGGIWISTALTSGSHEVELYFRPPGFVMGLVISLVCCLILAAISQLDWILRRVFPPEESDCNKTESTDDL